MTAFQHFKAPLQQLTAHLWRWKTVHFKVFTTKKNLQIISGMTLPPPAPPFFNEYGNPGCVPRLGGDDTHDLSLPHNERFKYWGDWGEPSNRANAARVWTVVRLMTLAEDSGPGSTWFGKFDPAKTLCRLNCYFNDTFSLCFVGFSECKGCQNPKRNVFPVSELTGNISTIKAWFLKHRQIRRFQKMHLLPIWQTSKPLLLPFSCTERYKYPRHVTYV